MIKEFHTEDAAKLADMFNESDEGWPGGFTHGVTITPDVVLDNIKKRKALSELVAWHEDKIVGIIEMTEYWQGKRTAYVAILNVIPRYHGKGFGRELLKACVEKGAELKYVRVDLHTWPGNMKAVPLYKKTGFFWVPKTTVHMKNFLPLILNLKAAEPYFSVHDWYSTFKRELTVEEDDHDGVYPYRWEENGDILSVTIDAESGGVSSFETNDFSISQNVENAFAGTTAQVTWTVKNKRSVPLTFTLVTNGTPDIEIEREENLTVTDEYTLTADAVISPEIEIRKEEEPPHLLASEVVIDGIPLTLTTGLRITHPVELSTSPEYLFLPPGKREILITLKNNTELPAEGTIVCQNTGESHPFSVESKHREAVPFTIEVTGDHELYFIIEGTRTIHTVPVRVRSRGASILEKNRTVVMENDHSRVLVSLLGGSLSIYDKHTRKFWIRGLEDQLGPPFWPSDLTKTRFTPYIEKSCGTVLVEVTGKSETHDCMVTKKIEMDASPVITISHSVTPQPPVELLLHSHGSMGGGMLTIPFTTALVSEPTLEEDFPLGHGDLPHDPGAFSEQWIAFEKDGSVFGMVWETCTRVELEDYHPVNIAQDAGTLRPVHLYMGRGTWGDVRAVWSRVHQEEGLEKKEPVRIWNVEPTILLTVDDVLSRELTFLNRRKKPLTGTIDGIPFTTRRDAPFTYTLAADHIPPGISVKTLHIETALNSTQVPITFGRVGKRGHVTIEEEDLITIENGLYTITIAPQFYGSVVFFGKENGVNHLLTSFPETTQFSWMKPWWGGISPTLFLEDNQFPGRMHTETFTHSVVEREIHSIPWSGVAVTCILKEIKGIQLETSYLTTAYSNLLVMNTCVKNRSTAPFSLNVGMFCYVQPDGSYEDAVLYYEGMRLSERKRTEYGAWTQCHEWAAVKGKETYLTVISDNIEVQDLGREGAHLYAFKKVSLTPRGEAHFPSYFIATDSLEQSRGYEILRRVSWT
jgi:GNAT superfamily N-acetyltransferase